MAVEVGGNDKTARRLKWLIGKTTNENRNGFSDNIDRHLSSSASASVQKQKQQELKHHFLMDNKTESAFLDSQMMTSKTVKCYNAEGTPTAISNEEKGSYVAVVTKTKTSTSQKRNVKSEELDSHVMIPLNNISNVGDQAQRSSVQKVRMFQKAYSYDVDMSEAKVADGLNIGWDGSIADTIHGKVNKLDYAVYLKKNAR